jgi:hypothetical protein
MERLCAFGRHFPCPEWDRAGADPVGNIQMSGFSFDPNWVRTLPARLAGVPGAVAALSLMGAALTSPSHAQAPPWGRMGASGCWPARLRSATPARP